MKYKAVLFDLDGTLLPMDQDLFTNTYFSGLVKKLVPFGYEKESVISAVWSGVKAMVLNDGTQLNETAFWKKFSGILGEKVFEDKPLLDEYYANEFDKVKEVCGFSHYSAEIIKKLKEKGIKVVLATNPLFPSVATKKRIGWAGLDPEDFELITTYENSRFCKPNPEYYKEIIEKINISPESLLMVGNDVSEDMIAENLGLDVFLLEDCIINKNNVDISKYPRGSFKELTEFIGLHL